jgi:hypothetical protein
VIFCPILKRTLRLEIGPNLIVIKRWKCFGFQPFIHELLHHHIRLSPHFP